MLNVLQKLAELEGRSTQVSKPVEKSQVLTETKKTELNLPEPDMAELRALSGFKKKLNESTIAECGMGVMGSPMPSMMPASLNMSAGNAQEIVSMMRGIMDLAKGETGFGTSHIPAMGAAMPDMGIPLALPKLGSEMGDVDGDGDHDMKDHDLEQPDSGPLTGDVPGVSGPTSFGPNANDSGDDEIADLIRKVKTGQSVKVSTDMPVKVTSDEPIKGSTTDKLNSTNDDNEEEGYDNSASDPNDIPKFDPNKMAHVINKIDSADMSATPFGSGSNPLPTGKKKEESSDPFAAFESKLFAEYKKFVAEGPKPEDVPAYIRKSKEPGKAAAKAANDKRNEKAGAKVWSSPRK
jgi:hypothetical protein